MKEIVLKLVLRIWKKIINRLLKEVNAPYTLDDFISITKLQRKTLECEELKEQLFEIKQKFKSFKKDANYYHKKYRTQRIKRIKIQNILEELINIILSFKKVEKYEHIRVFAEHAKEQMKEVSNEQ